MPKQCLDNAHAIMSSSIQLDQHRHETPAQAMLPLLSLVISINVIVLCIIFDAVLPTTHDVGKH